MNGEKNSVQMVRYKRQKSSSKISPIGKCLKIGILFGKLDLSEQNLNMDYMHQGLLFPRNRDIDGKVILVLKSKLHIRGLRDTKQLLRNFIYWIERLNR